MRLRVGGPVPNRKPQRNPWTVSGFPRWNTFAGLGCISTSRDAGTMIVAKGAPGGKRRGKRKRSLAKGNLCHGCPTPHKTEIEQTFYRANQLSMLIDRTTSPRMVDALMKDYEGCISDLYYDAPKHLDELIRREASRGQIRAKITARRLSH